MTTEPSSSGPELHRHRQVAESFGEDPERYDRARPPYPGALVDRVVAASPGPDFLNVGCGTGIEARQFQAAGCHVTGVEPDTRMAALARLGAAHSRARLAAVHMAADGLVHPTAGAGSAALRRLKTPHSERMALTNLCVTLMLLTMPGEAGTLIAGRYRLREPAGQGGRIWRAHDEFLDREVAVREILFSPQPPDVRADLIARTIREASAAASVDHPAVAAFYDVAEHENATWIVMQFVSAPALSAEVAQADSRIPLPASTIAAGPSSSPGRGPLAAGLAAAVRSRPRLTISATAGAVMIAALVLVVTPSRTSPVTQIGTFSDPQGFTPGYVAFSPDGKTIAASFDDGVSSEVSSDIFTWTPGSRRPPALLAWTAGTSVYGLAFSPASANALAYADDDDSGIEVWNVARHTDAAYKDPGGAAWFGGFASTQAGTAIAEVDPDGRVYLLDTANGKWLARHFTPVAAVTPVSHSPDEIFLSPDGQTVAALDGAKNLYVWNLSGAGDKPSVISGAGGAVFSPDSKTLAIAYPGRVRLWDVTTRAFSSVQLPGPGPQDSNNPVQDAMAFSANGATLAIAYGYHDAAGNGHYDDFDNVCLWNLATRTAVTFRAPVTSWGGLALSPDGDTLALAGNPSGNPGGNVYVYRVSH